MADVSDPKLVAEAAAQVAAWEVRLEFWENEAKAYNGLPLPEELKQAIEEVRRTLEHRRGMYRRLSEKLDAS